MISSSCSIIYTPKTIFLCLKGKSNILKNSVNMTKNYVLALDFDGVILDSAEENYYTGLEAYKKFKGPNSVHNFSLKKFLEGRPLCKSGEEFYLVFKMMDENPKINFKKISKKQWENWLDIYKGGAASFTKIFYQTRKKIMADNFEKWLKWQRPFRGILKEIKKAKKIFKKVLIATAKNKNSAKKILKHHGLNLEIVGREFSTHKHEQLTHLKGKFNVDYKNIIFIDDFIENLIVPKKLGVNVALAGWGYVRNESLKLAKKYNIPIFKRNNLLNQIVKKLNTKT